jgi:hypothetical protein
MRKLMLCFYEKVKPPCAVPLAKIPTTWLVDPPATVKATLLLVVAVCVIVKVAP